MKEWKLDKAKIHFSKIVTDAAKGEEQVLVENGKKVLVVMSYSKYMQLHGGGTLFDVFASAPKIELAIIR